MNQNTASNSEEKKLNFTNIRQKQQTSDSLKTDREPQKTDPETGTHSTFNSVYMSHLDKAGVQILCTNTKRLDQS